MITVDILWTDKESSLRLMGMETGLLKASVGPKPGSVFRRSTSENAKMSRWMALLAVRASSSLGYWPTPFTLLINYVATMVCAGSQSE